MDVPLCASCRVSPAAELPRVPGARPLCLACARRVAEVFSRPFTPSGELRRENYGSRCTVQCGWCGMCS